MRIKCDRNCLSTIRPSPRNDFAKHPRVRAVHAIEVSHADIRWSKIGRDILEFAEDLHNKSGARP